jgi:ComF family protein
MPFDGSPLPHQTVQQARRLSQAALDLLFPPRCAACGRVGSSLCEKCIASFAPLGEAVCVVCSTPLAEPGLCSRCVEQRPAFARVWSAFRYEGSLRRAILALKFRRRRALAPLLAEQMACVLERPKPSGAVLCAVPMHPERRAQRGYNHAGLLAEGLGERWGLPVLGDEALRRARQTPQQVTYDYDDRMRNVAGAFVAGLAAVDGRNIVLVDDVCTTGATLNACALALLDAGATAVYGITLARAL